MQYLSRNDCELIREGRRHSWWGNRANRRRTAIPRHTEIRDELVRKICGDLGVPPPGQG